MWEGIGLLLVYLVSGYLNKRKKEEQLRQSENDSIQDPGVDSGNNMKGIDPIININNRLADVLFGNSFRENINKTITSTKTRKQTFTFSCNPTTTISNLLAMTINVRCVHPVVRTIV